MSRLHQQQSRFMVGHIGVHRTNDTKIVRMVSKIRKQLAHHDTAVTMSGKLEGRRHVTCGTVLAGNVLAWCLALMLGKRRFGIESVDMRRSAIHEQKNDAFGPSRVMQTVGDRQSVARPQIPRSTAAPTAIRRRRNRHHCGEASVDGMKVPASQSTMNISLLISSACAYCDHISDSPPATNSSPKSNSSWVGIRAISN